MKQYEQKIDALGELYLVKKAPYTLPTNAVAAIVKYGPYINLVLLVISLPALIGLLGLSAMVSPLAYLSGVHYGFGYFVSIISLAAYLVLTGLSIPGLFKKSLAGWRLAWYAQLATAVGALLSMQLFSLILGLVISMYFLYQIKSQYK